MPDVTPLEVGAPATTCPVLGVGANEPPLTVMVEPWLVCVGRLDTVPGAVLVPVADVVVPCVVFCATVFEGVACAEPVPSVIVALI